MSQRETVIIATGELPPHSSRLSPHYGYVNHVIAVAFNEVNIKAKFHFLPWARAYKDANDAVYPASSYWYRDVKHEVGFYHSDTIIRDRVVFFRKKSALKLSSIDDIKRHRLRVGLTRGFTYSNEVWQWADENVDLVSIVNSDEQNLKMLVLGRIDVFPADEISGWYALNKNFSAEQVQTIETVAQGLINRDAVLLFSKAHAESERLMAAFNKGLQIIGEKGLLDEMTLQFVSGDYAENERH